MVQIERDSRWITVREAYDHYWPSRGVTHYAPGEYRVKNEVANGAVAKGKASEGKADGSEATPPPKQKAKTKAKPRAKKAGDVKTPNAGAESPVGDQSVPDADRPPDGPAVDSDAS